MIFFKFFSPKLSYTLLLLILAQAAFADGKLTGVVIGTKESVDYQTNTMSTTENTRDNAFDGDLNSYLLRGNEAIPGRDSTWASLL